MLLRFANLPQIGFNRLYNDNRLILIDCIIIID